MKTDCHLDPEPVLFGPTEAVRLAVIFRKCSVNGGFSAHDESDFPAVVQRESLLVNRLAQVIMS